MSSTRNRKRPIRSPYRSQFEVSVADILGDKADYEPERINFIQPAQSRYYLPDFKTKTGIYIECKGKWTSDDRKKHVWLREQHPEKRIVILFQNANVKLNKRSKTSYADWATKNNIEWLDFKQHGVPKELYIKKKK